MSDAGDAVRMALLEQLRAEAALTGVDGRDGGSEGRALPQLVVEPVDMIDWSTKTARGAEVRTAITLRVATGQALRLPSLSDAAARAGLAIGGTVGGWQVASAVLLRVRTTDRTDGTRVARVEHRVRVLECI